MTKEAFLRELEQHLQRVPAAERKEIMYDYEEHFRIGFEEGKTEEEIATSLGSPKTIAHDLLQGDQYNQGSERLKQRSSSGMVFTAIAMILVNAIFVSGIVGGIVGGYVGLSAGALALVFSPVIEFISILLNGSQQIVFGFFSTLMLTSLGLLWSIGMFYLGKWLWKMTVLYVKFNIRVIKGGN